MRRVLVSGARLRHSRRAMLATRCLAMVAATSTVACASVTELECDLECGEHQTCNVTDSTPTCECVPGYEGDPCTWTGVIRDPEFLDQDAWNTTKGVRIEPPDLANSDAEGVAAFPASALCAAGVVSQVVEMPEYVDAEPLVAHVRFRNFRASPTLIYGGTFTPLSATVAYPLWSLDRFCLGEAAYGGSVNFRISHDQPDARCFTAPEGFFEVDYFEIVPAVQGECVAPGVIAGGNVDDDGDAWEFDLYARDGPPVPEGAIVREVGASGTSAVRLTAFWDGTPRGATAITQISVPLPNDPVPSPALEFWWRSTPGWRSAIGLGTYAGMGQTAAFPRIDFLIGDGEAHVARYCLPPHLFGRSAELAFRLDRGPPQTEGELLVDEVRILDDPACGTSAGILDPQFNAYLNRRPGSEYTEFTPTAPKQTGVEVRVIENPELARSAPSALEMRYSTNRANLSLRQWVWVPAPRGDEWPRVSFYSNIPAEPPGKRVFWDLGNFTTSLDPTCFGEDPNLLPDDCIVDGYRQELLPGVGWRLGGDCLPTDWTERWVRLTFAVRDYDTTTPTVTYDPPRSVLLDDFEIIFDEGCAP